MSYTSREFEEYRDAFYNYCNYNGVGPDSGRHNWWLDGDNDGDDSIRNRSVDTVGDTRGAARMISSMEEGSVITIRRNPGYVIVDYLSAECVEGADDPVELLRADENLLSFYDLADLIDDALEDLD